MPLDRLINVMFEMIAVADPSERVCVNKELKFAKMLACVALNTLAAAIPIVHFNGLLVNLCSVYCHRVEALSIDFKGWEQYLAFVWSKHAKRWSHLFLSVCLSFLFYFCLLSDIFY